MSSKIPQNLFLNDDSTTIAVVKCNEDALDAQHLQPLLGATSPVLGIAAIYNKKCQLSSIAFSTLSHALVVNIPAGHIPQPQQAAKQQQVAKSRNLMQACLLVNPEFEKYAFRMDQLAVALYLDLSVRIDDAVDMLSVATGKGSRHSLQALMDALGGGANLRMENIQSLFFDTPAPLAVDAATAVALKAWAACRAATLPHMSSRFATIRRINTRSFADAHLAAVTSISRHSDRLQALNSTTVKDDQCSVMKGAVNLRCSHPHHTHVRNPRNQVIQIEVEGRRIATQATGHARRVDSIVTQAAGHARKVDSIMTQAAGHARKVDSIATQATGHARKVDSWSAAQFTADERVRGKKSLSTLTVGKGNLTVAESTREAIILETLQHKTDTFANPFFQAFWLPEERPTWPKSEAGRGTLPVYFHRSLNASQHAAVQRILSDKDDDRIAVIQGPPGTGKTTVIAASVISYDHANSYKGIWVTAQSNIGVKNIAEKLIKHGFRKFRFLVSKDFHYDWHKDLYATLEPCMIRSDKFTTSNFGAREQLRDCKVILCTLSMFSNQVISKFLHVVPMEMLILDEAGQIECGNYLPIFHHFRSTLSKVVFVGDDKQLLPYGQEVIPELRSVFGFPHLRRKALFLDTQYRMPHLIGDFISENVYDGKLLTQNDSTLSTVCRFIDVTKGDEARRGRSWINHQEARVVVKIVRMYQSRNMSFRVITPYDAQRAHIEDMLISENLPWEDRVLNIDSFQGNEDDHIIVSIVRSQGPGFLQHQCRTNVMLTRCRKSMVICSRRAFLFQQASETLVGKLAAVVDRENWIDGRDLLYDNVDLFA